MGTTQLGGGHESKYNSVYSPRSTMEAMKVSISVYSPHSTMEYNGGHGSKYKCVLTTQCNGQQVEPCRRCKISETEHPWHIYTTGHTHT